MAQPEPMEVHRLQQEMVTTLQGLAITLKGIASALDRIAPALERLAKPGDTTGQSLMR